MSQQKENRIQLIGRLLDEKGRTSRAFIQYVNEAREYGSGVTLHMREAHFVMAVHPGEGRVMSEIADALDITQGAVSQIALRLENKGYIIREKSGTDRRQTVVKLTEKGEVFYEAHSQYDHDAFSRADASYLSEFTDDELELFCRYEQTMRALFTKKNSKN